MTIELLEYHLLKPLLSKHFVRDSIPLKRGPFLEGLGKEEEIDFFKNSLVNSVEIPLEDVPETLRRMHEVKRKKNRCFKIDPKHGILYVVGKNFMGKCQTAITYYLIDSHKEGFQFREIVRVKGST